MCVSLAGSGGGALTTRACQDRRVYIVFGCLAYYSFGSATSQIALHMLVTRHNFVDIRIVEVLFCLSMVLLYPMQLLPVVQIFERWLGMSAESKGGTVGGE